MIYFNLLIIFLILIFIHELGHYLAAKSFGAKVTDFSIGFGKSILNFKDKSGTNWKISLLPLGGYVKIKGLESIFQNNNVDNEPDSFHSMNLFKKIFILLAGSLFNILSAWLCLFFILFFLGISTFKPEIGKIIENSPAEINDLRVGDLILKINENNISYFSDIPKYIGNSDFVSLEILRGNKLILKKIELIYDIEKNKYLIGIASNNKPEIIKYNLLLSIKQSSLFIPNYYKESAKYLSQSFKNNTITKELAGPVGIVKMADQLMLDQVRGVLLIFIMISLFIAIFNLLPIPLLDGGHIVYFILRSFFGNNLPESFTKSYLIIGISIISFLFIFVTFNDIFYK